MRVCISSSYPPHVILSTTSIIIAIITITTTNSQRLPFPAQIDRAQLGTEPSPTPSHITEASVGSGRTASPRCSSVKIPRKARTLEEPRHLPPTPRPTSPDARLPSKRVPESRYPPPPLFSPLPALQYPQTIEELHSKYHSYVAR